MRDVTPKDASLVPDSAKLVFKGIIYDTYQWEQKLYDGTFSTFEMLKRPDSVEVIAIKDESIVILNQEQPGGAQLYDLPSGRHDVESETELDAAKRELLEETGMKFRDWKLVDVKQPDSKIERFIYTFVATGFEEQTNQSLDAGEKIQIKTLSFEDLKQLLNDPKAQFIAQSIVGEVNSLEELINYPEYTSS